MSDWSDREVEASALDAALSDADKDATIPATASDSFSRTFANGLGAAEVGGSWTLTGSNAAFKIEDGHALVTLTNAGDGVAAFLTQVSNDDVDLQITLSVDKTPIGGSGVYVSLVGRRIDNNNDYNGRVIFREDGNVYTGVSRNQGGTENVLPGATAVFSARPQEAVRARLQVTGASPTHLRIKLWKAADAEPSAWIVDTEDSTASLQSKGTIGLRFYLATSTANAPIAVTLDDLLVRPASRL